MTAAPFDPALVTIERKRFSVTQGEVLVSYNGTRIEQYGDAIKLVGKEYIGMSDDEWIAVARREAIARGLATEPTPPRSKGVFDLPPESHADLAREAEGRQAWAEAAQHWTNARTTSQGHKRRERYDEAAERCRAATQGPAPRPKLVDGLAFERSDYDRNRYKVFQGDSFLGFVKRIEGWTVRGRPVTWQALRSGRHVGTEQTRLAAAKLLAKGA